jgi:dolichol-phosphate mannosyltransferase
MGTIIEINKRKIKIKEIPIIFKDRVYGLSKIPKIEIFRTLKNLLIYFILRICRK